MTMRRHAKADTGYKPVPGSQLEADWDTSLANADPCDTISDTQALLSLIDSASTTSLQDSTNTISWPDDLQFVGWNNHTNVCEWTGVTCGEKNNRVERLELNQKSYHGTLTTELSCLTELTMLLMSDNGMQGSIPEELGEKLTNLVLVDLSINDLKGSIPLFESSQLQELKLGDNRLTGTIAETMSSNKPNLYTLDLSYNNLEGTIPDTITDLLSLKELEMSNNRLTGYLPTGFDKLINLENIFLQKNQLIGTIPQAVFGADSQLKNLWLEENSFSGSLPQSLSDLVNLEHLKIARNFFQGTVPQDLCDKLASSENISDEEKCFEIACPIGFHSLNEEGFGECVECQGESDTLFLGSTTCHTTNEREILSTVYDNNIGSDWIGSDGSWEDTNADTCTLQGVECNQNGSVQKLDLSYRNLSGKIEKSIGYMTNLQELDLSSNQLTGKVPVELSLLPLTYLNIANNRITGDIPSVLCQKNDVNGNGVDGSFSCSRIACPVGSFSSTGYETNLNECGLCNDQVNYIGRITCDDASSDDASSGEITSGFIIGLSAALALVAFGFVGWFIVRRVRKQRYYGSWNKNEGTTMTSVTIGDGSPGDERLPFNTVDASYPVDEQSSAGVSKSSSRSSKKEVWLDVPRI